MISTEAVSMSGVMRARGLVSATRSVRCRLGFDGGDAIFQRLVCQVGDAAFDGGIEPRQPAFRVGLVDIEGRGNRAAINRA
jgi:hypothetical protein